MKKKKFYDILTAILTAILFILATWFCLNHEISVLESFAVGGAAAISFQLFFGDPFPEEEDEFED